MMYVRARKPLALHGAAPRGLGEVGTWPLWILLVGGIVGTIAVNLWLDSMKSESRQ